MGKKVVFHSKYSEDYSAEDSDEIQTTSKTFEMLSKVIYTDRISKVSSSSPKLINQATKVYLYERASPTYKKLLMEYMLAPPDIIPFLEMERTGKKTVEIPELVEFRDLYALDIDASELMDELPLEIFEFIVSLERSLYQDFNYLSAYRESGMGIGMIPLTQIEAYIRLKSPNTLQSISLGDFVDSIRNIDSKYVGYHADKQKEESKKNASNPPSKGGR